MPAFSTASAEGNSIRVDSTSDGSAEPDRGGGAMTLTAASVEPLSVEPGSLLERDKSGNCHSCLWPQKASPTSAARVKTAGSRDAVHLAGLQTQSGMNSSSLYLDAVCTSAR